MESSPLISEIMGDPIRHGEHVVFSSFYIRQLKSYPALCHLAAQNDSTNSLSASQMSMDLVTCEWPMGETFSTIVMPEVSTVTHKPFKLNSGLRYHQNALCSAAYCPAQLQSVIIQLAINTQCK